MSDTAVSLLTPPGAGAIATVEVRGPRAWELVKQLFKPAGKPLPESPEVNRFWFGTLGADEVVLAATGPDSIETHCHGGPRVVRWVIEQFTSHGCVEASRTPRPSGEGFDLLQRAPTLRTASILLDQLNGAFSNEVRRILALLEADPASAHLPLLLFVIAGRAVGRHLVEPWKIVFAGAPNVGKSSLVNALAGYQRAVVSEVAGTTRDTVGVRVAFDGWPFELIDTAGIRSVEGLEAEGVARTGRELHEADLVVWVLDGTAAEPVWPSGSHPEPKTRSYLFVINKADRPLSEWARAEADGRHTASATTGAGLPDLINSIVFGTAGADELAPGAPVPFTPRLIELVDAANAALFADRPSEAARLLREALAAVE